MEWDKKIAAKYKELSVKTSDEMIVGKIYYCNSLGGKNHAIIYLGRDEKDDSSFSYKRYDEEGYWKDKIITGYYRDENIDCKGYNPWFLFESEETARQCREELNKTIYFDLLV